MSDTIAAIATGTARTAIGILRLSGPRAAEIVSAVFRPAGGGALRDRAPGTLVYGVLRDREGQEIDHCLATWSLGPRSYTGEDTAELQCHGSPVVLTAGLEALFVAGARQAERGEFTKRAFLNGKMDLTQAEAVIDLVDAPTRAAARNAVGQLAGAMGRRLGEVYDRLVDLMAHFHAVLDYPDEDIEPFEAEEIRATLAAEGAALARLAATYRRGRLLTQGVPTAIVGRPNAGKSSLLNALLGYDRAIVTPVPGTTRDTVEETATLGGVLLRLIDTAGLRDAADQVEKIGVERSRAALERAELALLVIDGSRPLDEEDRGVMALAEGAPRVICLVNKADLPGKADMAELAARFPALCVISAKEGQGLEALEDKVAALFPHGAEEENGMLLTNARQAQAVDRAAKALTAAGEGLAAGTTPDAVLSDVEVAMAALGEVTGRTLREDITARIFERFCVGK